MPKLPPMGDKERGFVSDGRPIASGKLAVQFQAARPYDVSKNGQQRWTEVISSSSSSSLMTSSEEEEEMILDDSEEENFDGASAAQTGVGDCKAEVRVGSELIDDYLTKEKFLRLQRIFCKVSHTTYLHINLLPLIDIILRRI